MDKQFCFPAAGAWSNTSFSPPAKVSDLRKSNSMLLSEMEAESLLEQEEISELKTVLFERRRKLRRFVRRLWESMRGTFVREMSCKWLWKGGLQNAGSERTITGTLFGMKKGHVNFALQEDPMREPEMLVQMPTATKSLVKEMASGLVRIALECNKESGGLQLLGESVWRMFCNGRKCGFAVSKKKCSPLELNVLLQLQAVSVGAGVVPAGENDDDEDDNNKEIMYMRASFKRIVGSDDCEAFYMINPDGTGAPELSIFLLRI